jgi:chemotaxis protein MotB
MRKLMLVVGLAAVVGCAGSKKELAAKDAEAAKYKQAAAEQSGKVTALESKVNALQQQTKSLQQENAALQAKANDLQTRLTGTSAEKSEMQSRLAVRLNEQLLFKENSSKLAPESKHALDSLADAIAQLKGKAIIVGGFTDDKEGGAGKDANAKRWQLSTARGLEIAKYLAGRGLDPALIAVAGFGAGRPVAPNDSLANRALNRRAEIALLPSDLQLGTVDVEKATLKENK